MIIFENIDTGETIGIDRKTGGQHYRAKLSAVMNSSNLSVNADRGQDKGWRLAPEQQALIEIWERDPEMIDRVSTWSKVMIDDLTHSEFLSYLLYQQELGMSPEQSHHTDRRAKEAEYQARVEALKAATGEEAAAPVAPFDPKVARGEATVEDFLNGDVTGDAGGDKGEPEELTPADHLSDLDKVLAETGAGEPQPAVEDAKPAEPKAPKSKAPKK